MSTVLSLNPDDAVQGGLLDDADVIIESARCDFFTYPNGTAAVGAIVAFKDAEDKVHEQFYSAGGQNKIVPNEEKTGLVAVEGVTVSGVVKTTNLMAFLASLKEAGYNTAGLTDISTLAGLRVHVNRKTVQKQAGDPADAKDRSILLVAKILEAAKKGAAGAKKSTAAGAPATAKTTTAAAPAGNAELDDKTAGAIFEIIMGAGGTVEAKKIPAQVFQNAKKAQDADALKMSQRSADAKFLASRSEFTVDGANLKVE
jgi:hypothetical protein